MLRKFSILILSSFLLVIPNQASADLTVLAAASLTDALTDINKSYQAKTTTTIKTSFSSSSTLAKQIESGLPADIFISADLKWMDYLYDKGKIDGNSRVQLLGNSLVLIAPKGKAFKAALVKGGNLANAFAGNLCTGETETVPVGKYAKEALQNLGLWDAIKARVVGAEDVRSALAFVESGECEAGIVYGTDADISKKVEIVAHFPEDSHAAIIYPMALVSQAPEAKAYFTYLQSTEAASIFKKYGFKRLTP